MPAWGPAAELAFKSMSEHGIASEWTYPYTSYQGENFKCHFNATTTSPAANVVGSKKLPSNEELPLLRAVAEDGPISISVDASAWAAYESGVFDGCNQSNPDLDHVCACFLLQLFLH